MAKGADENDNAQCQNTAPVAVPTGTGRALIEALNDGNPQTQLRALQMIQQHNRENWAPPNDKAHEIVPRIVYEIATTSEKEYLRLAAAQTLVGMRKNNLDGLAKLLEAERPENGSTTFNVGVQVSLTPERLRAIADTLDPPEE
jgi:hypothetical protein